MSPPSHLRHAPSLHCRKRGLFQIHVNVSSELKRFQTPVNWGFHSERGKRREEEEVGRGGRSGRGGGGGRRGGRREKEEGGRGEGGEGGEGD